MILVDLGPHFPVSVKLRRCLSGRRLGNVECHWPGVAYGCLCIVGDLLPRRHVVDAGVLGAGGALVASDVFRLDVRHGAIALEVSRLPDVLPISRPVDAREGVYDSADLLTRLRFDRR